MVAASYNARCRCSVVAAILVAVISQVVTGFTGKVSTSTLVSSVSISCYRRKPRSNLAMKARVAGRASLDDVERLSRGQAAKKRGTGSRAVCHRLNETERKAFDLAKKQGYVVLRGTGYRRERKGSPLQNIYRQFCDAKAMACICVLTGLGQDAAEEVEIDFSPLRKESVRELQEQADTIARDRQADRVPERSVAVTGEGLSVEDCDTVGSGDGEQNAAVEDDRDNDDDLSRDLDDLPIWKHPVVSRFYRCETRKEAKELAQTLSALR